MAKVCMVTGKRPMAANKVSHSNIKTKTRKYPNLMKRRFWVPGEKRWVTLRVSARGVRIIEKRGIEAVLTDLHA